MTQSAYSATGIISTGAISSVGDIITITGAVNSKVNIIVTRFKLTATATPSQRVIVSAVKRSSPDTGGTFIAATKVPNDSLLSPSIATGVGHYTANPTPGTAIGTVKIANVLFSNGNSTSDEVEWELDQMSGLHITLKGTNEQLCVNLNGANFPQAPTIAWELHWIED